MKLLIDAGNTRVKWQVQQQNQKLSSGWGALGGEPIFQEARPYASSIERVAISTVASEGGREQLIQAVSAFTNAPVRFYWTEAQRNELRCAYEDPRTMGADRWHALYGAWRRHREALVVVDAGSAVTVDFVSAAGMHAGGYILPGRGMMLRGLRQDAARIAFADTQADSLLPGTSTTECVHHGLHWLWRGLVNSLHEDCRQMGVDRILLTGGDADELLSLGLAAELVPDLVFEGLAAIDSESPP